MPGRSFPGARDSTCQIILGFSGECTACAFDERGLLDNIDLLSPELAYALESLAVWLYQRVRRGDVEIDAKRLCWGWEPEEDPEEDPDQQTIADPDDDETARAMVGCDEESCATRESPTWVLQLPEDQRINRADVLTYWNQGIEPVAERFTHLADSTEERRSAV